MKGERMVPRWAAALAGLCLIHAAPASAAITNLAVQDAANAADWSIQSNLQTGNVQYGDRVFTLSTVPSAVAGSEWIRTANDSKTFTGATLVTFTVTSDADVYVAHNDSITTKPAWLSAANGWTDSGANLVNSEPRTFSLFRKSFLAGASVALGNNGNTSSSCYTIVVKAAVVTPTPTPTTPPPTAVKLTPVGVTASTHDGNVPANTLDGNLATRWSGNGDGAWIQYDLGSAQTVSFVKIAVYNGNSRRNQFQLQVGDGTTWDDVIPNGLTSGTTTQLEIHEFADTSTRFVRYLGHMSNAGTFNSLTEVEIWGDPCSACPTPTPTPVTPTPTPTPVTPTPTPTATLPPGGNVLESDVLRLELTPNPYTYRILEKPSGRVLVSHSATRYTIGGTVRTVASASSVSNNGTTMSAMLALSGTANTAHVAFTLTSPDVVRVLLTANNAAPSNVTEEFNDQGEHYYGLWNYHVGNGIDNRGADQPMLGFGRRTDTNFCSARAPFYVTTRNYGIYTQSQAQGHYRVAVGGKTSASFNETQLRYHVFTGSYAGIFSRYNALAGPSFMPPLWGFDSIWWRDDNHQDLAANGVSNGQQLAIRDADRLREHRIHASAIWLDRPYGTGTQGWGNLDFDSSFPNPSQMVTDLRNRGINLLVWITNRCANRLLTEGQANDYVFDGFSSWPAADLRKPAAYDWFKNHLNFFVNLGIRGYKIDRGEEGEMPDSVQNQMVTLYAKLSKEGRDARHPGDNLVFARNVYDTGRRYEAVWNGDTFVSWGGLTASIKNALRSGAMNMPMYGSDIGGYASGTLTKELYARWFQLGAYHTMMEIKIGPSRTPWITFDSELIGIARAQAAAHHDMIPYTRSNLFDATQTCYPVIRQLVFDWPTDSSLFTKWDQFLYGPAIMVAPVTTDGARSRSVYLPAGRWMDYNNRTTLHTGPTTFTASAPLSTIPLFVRAGSIVPRGDILRANNNWTPGWAPNLRVEIFPSGSTSFPYYTGSAVRNITSTLSGGTLNVDFGDLGTNGRLEIYVDGVGSVTRNGVPLAPGSDYTYSSTSKLLTVPYTGATSLVVQGTSSLF